MNSLKVIIVTGGAGFIGSHVCKSLSSRGYLPVTFDNLSTGHREAVKWGPLVVGDVRDAAAFDRAFEQYSPIAVMHFAASAYVGESVAEPAKYYDNNVRGMLNLLDSMLRANVRKLIFSSSCATYGVPEQLPISELTSQAPINPYGRTKLVGEMILADYASAYDLDYIALRYFNVAGADAEGQLVERHDPETHLIPRVLMAVLGAIEHVDIYGDDYPTQDGTCVRDYVHVADIATGHVLALERILSGRGSLKLNLGSGVGYSVKQILQVASEVTGTKVPYAVRPRRAGDPPELLADISAAHLEIGYRPVSSDLKTLIETAWRSAKNVHQLANR
jgi:UDP-arabinose 4-epimerase